MSVNPMPIVTADMGAEAASAGATPAVSPARLAKSAGVLPVSPGSRRAER
jgi:hypothetical protein